MTTERRAWEGARPVPLASAVLIGAVLWIIPAPQGVSDQAWHLNAIFIATIVGIVSKALPMGAVAMIGISIVALTGVTVKDGSEEPFAKESIENALSGFGEPIIWLIVVAFFIARGFIKTGLGARIAYVFVKHFGQRSLGLSYALLGADLVIAPAIPSNTARARGILYPIMKSLSLSFGSDPKQGTARKIGAFLTMTTFHGNLVTSAMFMTAMAANPIAANLASDKGVDISWGYWALAASVPGLISLVAVPYILYRIYPPEIKETPEAGRIAREKLAAMGSLRRSEWILLATFVGLLALWIFGRNIGIAGTTAGLVGLGALLVTGVLSWDDIKAERAAWDTLVWFSALVMMAKYLEEMKLIDWFGAQVGASVTGMPWPLAFVILIGVYFYVHYLFASSTAHVFAMYATFLAVGISVSVPPMLMALALGFTSNLYGAMTHYGQGTAPVLFGGGYVELKTWWRIGFVMSLVFIVIWLGIGTAWWKVIGVF